MNEIGFIFSQAYESFLQKRFKESLSILENAKKILESEYSLDWEVSIKNLTGFNYLGLQLVDIAKVHFENALNIDPNSSQACSGLAEIFYLNHQDSEAKTMYEYAIINNPENNFALSGLCKVNRSLGLPDNHNSLCEDKADTQDKFKDIIKNVSSYFEKGNYVETIDSINSITGIIEDELLNKKTLLTELFNMQGIAYLNLSKYDESRLSFEKALNLSPDSSTACWGLAEIFYHNNMLSAAKEMYEWAVKNDDNNQAAIESLQKINGLLGYQKNHNSINKPTLKLASGKIIEL